MSELRALPVGVVGEGDCPRGQKRKNPGDDDGQQAMKRVIGSSTSRRMGRRHGPRPRRARRRRPSAPAHRPDRRARARRSCSICRSRQCCVMATACVLDDGAIVRVAGLPEPLVEIGARTPRPTWCGSPGTSATATPTCRSRAGDPHPPRPRARGDGRGTRRHRAAIDAPFEPEGGARSRTPAMSTTVVDELPRCYRLMAWLSPSYPVGAFSYSGGIEWAVETRDITDAESLRRWLASVIGEGAGFCDAVFFVHAIGHRDRGAALQAVAELAAAFAPSKERFLETTAQGQAFNEATRAVAVRRPRPARRRLEWAGGLPGRGRRRGCGPRDRCRARLAGLPARGRRQPDLGRRPADPARADRRSARAGRARTSDRRHRQAGTGSARSTMSAPLRFAPTWQASCMKPSTQGCFDHEHPRSPACRCRRPGRFRQDRADGRALQAPAGALRDRRHHQ